MYILELNAASWHWNTKSVIGESLKHFIPGGKKLVSPNIDLIGPVFKIFV